MKARTAIAWTAHRVRLTAVGWGLTTMLACVVLSACTSSPSTSPAAVYSPTVSGSATATSTASATASASASASASAGTAESPAESDTGSPTPETSLAPSPAFSTFPTEAPVTGGGGTAGFQDAGLAVLGGAAIVAGIGSIAYRRRMTRNR